MRVLGALSLLVACLALAACGEETERDARTPKQRYEQAFKDTVREWQKRGEGEVPDVAADAPLPEQAEALAGGVELMEGLAADLGRLSPPADVRDAHRDYVRGLEMITEDFGKLVTAMRRNDRATVEREMSGRGFAEPEHVRLVARARVRFQRRGYDLGIDELALPGGG